MAWLNVAMLYMLSWIRASESQNGMGIYNFTPSRTQIYSPNKVPVAFITVQSVMERKRFHILFVT